MSIDVYKILCLCLICMVSCKENTNHGCEFGQLEYGVGTKKCYHDPVQLAVVACGERVEEALVMIKSAVLFGTTPLHLHIFRDESNAETIKKTVDQYVIASKWRPVTYQTYPIQYPIGEKEWTDLFKPCSSQRLFIPHILNTVDAVLYADIDILFLRPIEEVWQFLKMFDKEQLAAVVQESEDASGNWYIRFARHKFVKPYGINTGVMLMNLTRIRASSWASRLYPILKENRYNISWGDQDILNIFFSEHKEKLYFMDCSWNYRPDHCMYMHTCQAIDHTGIAILHGSRSYFTIGKQPPFRITYEAIKKVNMNSPLTSTVWMPMSDELKRNSTHSHCGNIHHFFEEAVIKATAIRNYCIAEKCAQIVK